MSVIVTAAEALRVLAQDAADDLAALTDKPSYTAAGNHDATHRPKDLESSRAIRTVAKAETVLRMVVGLIAEGEHGSPGTAVELHRDSKGRFAGG